LFSAALVSRISAWRVCSFQPPPPRLAKSLCLHADASGVLDREQSGKALRNTIHLPESGLLRSLPDFRSPDQTPPPLRVNLTCPQEVHSACSFGCTRQKSSTCHTFFGPPASAIASIRPFGDGTACQISGLLDLSRTVALPSNETFSKALSRSKLCQETRSVLPSADQLMPVKPFHPFTTRSRVCPVEVERSWILSWLGP
jgi:hypothetical protein